MRWHRWWLAAGLGVACLIGGARGPWTRQASARAARIHVQVQAAATVETERVSLGQVAAVTLMPVEAGADSGQLASGDSGDMTPGWTLEQLQQVEIARVPLPGQTIRMPAGFLAVKLRQAGINPADLVLELPAGGWIEITRVLPAVPTAHPPPPSTEDRGKQWSSLLLEQLQAAIRARLQDQLGGSSAGAVRLQVNLAQVIGWDELLRGLPADVPQPGEAQPVPYTWDLGGWRPAVGPFILFASLRAGDRRVGSVTVNGDWQVERQVLVAARSLAVGQTITAADVQSRWVSGLASGEWLFTPEQAVGRVVQRPLPAGEPILATALAQAPLYEKGTPFTARVQRGQVVVEVQLRAIEAGLAGKPFRAINEATGQVLSVVVDQTGQATVLGLAG
ncbi:MAG: flagellar basal body P-ring formation protein FlgA [Limnochordaceae bacterium]|nr:flagellar basal body P-ring formation protein FlgA [Limnochordaceae bacterium]